MAFQWLLLGMKAKDILVSIAGLEADLNNPVVVAESSTDISEITDETPPPPLTDAA